MTDAKEDKILRAVLDLETAKQVCTYFAHRNPKYRKYFPILYASADTAQELGREALAELSQTANTVES
jgi:hypothetical protein